MRLVQSTPNPEETMAYIARVSNPNNQDNPSFEGLLKYCINHGQAEKSKNLTSKSEVG